MAAAASWSTASRRRWRRSRRSAQPVARRASAPRSRNASPPSAWRATMCALYERLIAADRPAMFGKIADQRPDRMNEIVRIGRGLGRRHEPHEAPESYHIEATKSLVDRTLRTLKHDDLFGVFDKQGDCRGGDGRAGRPLPPGHALPLRPRAPDRRHGAAAARLGRCSTTMARWWSISPMPISTTPTARSGCSANSIHAARLKFLCGTTCYERIRVRSFGPVGRRDPARTSPSTPISPTCSRCAASAGRGAAR